MMEVLLAALLLLVAVAATLVVFTRDPGPQAVVLSAYGVLVGVLMIALQAPDVAMSELAVGAAIVPLLIVLTIGACRRAARTEESPEDRS